MSYHIRENCVHSTSTLNNHQEFCERENMTLKSTRNSHYDVIGAAVKIKDDATINDT